ncbi:hypothetical protein GCM10023322_43300 [Rugosimonospora acidiphila]|uniref:Uncharacterized protein n=1 Tax=Rugosimonospora acidiphila TaxID=556531 RepID=A0ABP9S2R4_9ACTN
MPPSYRFPCARCYGQPGYGSSPFAHGIKRRHAVAPAPDAVVSVSGIAQKSCPPEHEKFRPRHRADGGNTQLVVAGYHRNNTAMYIFATSTAGPATPERVAGPAA